MGIKYNPRLKEYFNHAGGNSVLVRTVGRNNTVDCVPIKYTVNPNIARDIWMASTVTYRINDGEIVTLTSPGLPGDDVTDWTPFDNYYNEIAKLTFGYYNGGYHHPSPAMIYATDDETYLNLGGLKTNGLFIDDAQNIDYLNTTCHGFDSEVIKLIDVVPSEYKIEILKTPEDKLATPPVDMYDILTGILDLPEPVQATLLSVPETQLARLTSLSELYPPIVGFSCAKYIAQPHVLGMCEHGLRSAQGYLSDEAVSNITGFSINGGQVYNFNGDDDSIFDLEFYQNDNIGILFEAWSDDVNIIVDVRVGASNSPNPVKVVLITADKTLALNNPFNDYDTNCRLNEESNYELCLNPDLIRCSNANNQMWVKTVGRNSSSYSYELTLTVATGELTVMTLAGTNDAEGSLQYNSEDGIWSATVTRGGHYINDEYITHHGIDLTYHGVSLTPTLVELTVQDSLTKTDVIDYKSTYLDGDAFYGEVGSAYLDSTRNAVKSCVKTIPCWGATEFTSFRCDYNGIRIEPKEYGDVDENIIPPFHYDVVVNGTHLNPNHEDLFVHDDESPETTLLYGLNWDPYQAELNYRLDYRTVIDGVEITSIAIVEFIAPPGGQGITISENVMDSPYRGGNNPTVNIDSETGNVKFCIEPYRPA